MEVKAQLKNARIAPRKVRWLRDSVLTLPVGEARAQLKWQTGKAAKLLLAVLNSAVANAKHNFDAAEDNLKVSRLEINGGAVFKRWRPASKGMAHPYVKRTAHILIGVDEIKAQRKKRQKRKAEIDTVSVEDLAKSEPKADAETGNQDEAPTGRAAMAQPDEAMKAYQKKKIQQQGGDRKKTHRRKSA